MPLALVLLAMDDRAGYRKACNEANTRWPNIDDPDLNDVVARTCSLAADVLDTPDSLMQRAMKAVESNPIDSDYLATEGAALDRFRS